MPTIPSNPLTFTTGTGAFPQTLAVTVTFTIPAGVWASGTWSVDAGWSVTSSSHADITTSGGTVSTTPSHGSTGATTDTATVSAAQMADINAAAGGADLSVSFTAPVAVVPPVAGHVDVTSFTLTLAGCAYSLSPSSASVDGLAHTGTFDVTTSSLCPWTAVSNDSWLHVTVGSSGTGSGTVSYSVDANPYPAPGRVGTITAGGQTFTVTQDAGIDPDLGTGATVTLVSGGKVFHPHTNAIEQFLTVSYPHGYQPSVNTSLGSFRRTLFNLVKPSAMALAVLTGTTLNLYDTSGVELVSGTPCDGVTIWRFGF